MPLPLGYAPVLALPTGFEPVIFTLKGCYPKPLDEGSRSMQDWWAIGMSAATLLISATDFFCRRRDRRYGNYVPKTLAVSPTTPPPKPRKK